MSEPSPAPDATEPSPWRPARYHVWQGRKIVCELCPRRCGLDEGEDGWCGVRRRESDQLWTLAATPVIAQVDPVERKPLYHFRPGLRLLTLAAPGCTLSCRYCLNHRLSQAGRHGGSWEPVRASAAALVARARAEGLGIAFSYAEPSLSIELFLEIAALAGDLPLVWKSSGYVEQGPLDDATSSLHAVNLDLKAADDEAHRWLCGAPLAPVLRSLDRLREAGVWVELSTPLVPGLNDAPRQIAAMARVAARAGAPWHLARFVPEHRLQDRPPTGPEGLAAAREIALDQGVSHVYIERALGAQGRQTRCGCGAIVVERELWAAGRSRLVGGRCPDCGAAVPGVWAEGAGGAVAAGPDPARGVRLRPPGPPGAGAPAGDRGGPGGAGRRAAGGGGGGAAGEPGPRGAGADAVRVRR